MASTARRIRGLGAFPDPSLGKHGAARMLWATRNGPRISSSAVTAIVANPAAAASSAVATKSRVLPIPGSPSRVTAVSRDRPSSSCCLIAASSTGRPMTAPVTRRSWHRKRTLALRDRVQGADVGDDQRPAAVRERIGVVGGRSSCRHHPEIMDCARATARIGRVDGPGPRLLLFPTELLGIPTCGSDNAPNPWETGPAVPEPTRAPPLSNRTFFHGSGAVSFSTKGEYGVRLMVQLGLHHGHGPASLAEIAQDEDLPRAYLEQLVMSLRDAGLVRSTRGAHGGYELARDPSEIRMSEVLRALEGPIAPMVCATDDPEHAATCDRSSRCTVNVLWVRVRDAIVGTLDSMTLDELVPRPYPGSQPAGQPITLDPARPAAATRRTAPAAPPEPVIV